MPIVTSSSTDPALAAYEADRKVDGDIEKIVSTDIVREPGLDGLPDEYTAIVWTEYTV